MVTPEPVIEVRQITKRFGGVVALDDVSINFRRGEFHSVVGENGAGKSTLMKILSGVISDYQGKMIVAGKTQRFKNTREAEENGIGIIHQELNLVDELTAAANIFLGREKHSAFGWLRDREMEKDATRLFEELGCEIDPSSSVRDLRVGNQQLVEIAKALSFHSEILIMDEPTSALSEVEVERLFAILERLIDRGVTVIYISHKLDEVFRMSDRITVLRDGQVVKTLDSKETTPKEITQLMVGREIEAIQFEEERQPTEVLLEVASLSLPWVGHARQWRLQNINFTLRRGEVLGIAGLMGAGRTELLECLFGIAAATPVGKILLNGKPVLFSHPAEAMRHGVALVTEDRKRLGLFDQMLVRENVTICTLGESTTAGVVSMKMDRLATQNSIRELGIRCDGTEAKISSLSGGNQQKCIIARWLKTNPQVLLLDDPTRGIDVGAKAEIYQVIDDLCKQGMGIIFTSSELPELLTICDRILVLCEGKLTREFAKAEFHEAAIMEAATDRS